MVKMKLKMKKLDKLNRLNGLNFKMFVDKKAQLKIHQMAFMLVGLVLFFSLVGLLLVSIRFSSIRESALILEERNAKLLVSRISNSPEFSCTQDLMAGDVDCIDSDKIMALTSQIEKYHNFWGVKGIEIRKIYPSEINENMICNSQNYPDCNLFSLIKSESGTGISNFVSLCRKEDSNGNYYDKCEIAKVIITYN